MKSNLVYMAVVLIVHILPRFMGNLPRIIHDRCRSLPVMKQLFVYNFLFFKDENLHHGEEPNKRYYEKKYLQHCRSALGFFTEQSEMHASEKKAVANVCKCK